jgi:uncharacterized membrane protein (UPF0127 family)
MEELINKTNGIRLEINRADTFFKRFLGLMGRKRIANMEGLLFMLKKPSKFDAAIHMLFMNFDIAVIWLSDDFVVIDQTLAKKWHLSYMPKDKAKYYLETHPSQLANFTEGDHLELVQC